MLDSPSWSPRSSRTDSGRDSTSDMVPGFNRVDTWHLLAAEEGDFGHDEQGTLPSPSHSYAVPHMRAHLEDALLAAQPAVTSAYEAAAAAATSAAADLHAVLASRYQHNPNSGMLLPCVAVVPAVERPRSWDSAV